MELGSPRHFLGAQNQCLQHQQDQKTDGGEIEAIPSYRQVLYHPTSVGVANFTTGSPLAPITWPEEFQTQSWEDYKKFWSEHDPRDADNDPWAET